MAQKKTTLNAHDAAVVAYFAETLYLTAEDIDETKPDPTENAYLEIHHSLNDPDDGELVAVYELVRVARLDRETTHTLRKV